MKKAMLASLAAAALLLAAGCETTQANTAGVKEPEGEVITGSRIPRKAGSGAESVGTMSGGGYKQEQMSRSGGEAMRGQ